MTFGIIFYVVYLATYSGDRSGKVMVPQSRAIEKPNVWFKHTSELSKTT